MTVADNSMDSTGRHALVFMAKWPEPGRAKTRLTPALTPAEAAELARGFLLDMLAEAARVDADRWLAFTPVSATARLRALCGPDVGLIPAEMDDFGAALRHAQSAALALGYRSVSLVASDLPHLPVERYLEAFDCLRTADVVIGPSADGGYYLLTAQSETPALFEGIAWSTASVYRATLERAQAEGLRVATIAPCDDIDTPADLEPLFATLRHRPGAGHTLQALSRLDLPRDVTTVPRPLRGRQYARTATSGS